MHIYVDFGSVSTISLSQIHVTISAVLYLPSLPVELQPLDFPVVSLISCFLLIFPSLLVLFSIFASIFLLQFLDL